MAANTVAADLLAPFSGSTVGKRILAGSISAHLDPLTSQSGLISGQAFSTGINGFLENVYANGRTDINFGAGGYCTIGETVLYPPGVTPFSGPNVTVQQFGFVISETGTAAPVYTQALVDSTLAGNQQTALTIASTGTALGAVTFGNINGENMLSIPGGAGGATIIGPVQLWEGFDSVMTAAGYGRQQSWRYDPISGHNFLMFGGIQSGNAHRPLLIEAATNGTEISRSSIFLSNPLWDKILASANSSYQIFPCNAGWYVPISITDVNPPMFILFNPDCSKYWIYFLQAYDAGAINGLFNQAWGTSGSQRLYLDAPLPAPGTQSGDELLIIGTGVNDGVGNVIFSNEPFARTMPFIPAVGLPCTPCVPQIINYSGGQPAFMGSITG